MQDNNENMFEKAEKLIKQGSFDYAYTLLEQLLKIKPDNAKITHFLHVANIKRFNTNNKNKLKLIYYSIIYLPYTVIGIFSYLFENHKKALYLFEKILKKLPKNTYILETIAKIYNTEKNIEAESFTYKEILLISENNISALKRLGKISLNQGDIQAASKYYDKLNELNPNDPELKDGLKNLDVLSAIENRNKN
jgi:tetratricopeptide (TPR) repeat protein